MKRLTVRFRNWLAHRRRYASKRRNAALIRLSRIPSMRRIVRLCKRLQTFAGQLAYRDSFYVVWAYSQRLQLPEFEIPGDIEVAHQFLEAVAPRAVLAEWTLEQITREVIKHGNDEPREGRRLRQWATLAQIAN